MPDNNIIALAPLNLSLFENFLPKKRNVRLKLKPFWANLAAVLKC